MITGATGDVGSHLSRELAGKYSLGSPTAGSRPGLQGGEVHQGRRLEDDGRAEITGRRRHGPSRRLLGRRPVGGDPRGEHHRLLQCVRGGAPQRREAHPLRRPATTRSASTRAPRPSTTGSTRSPTAATACRRCSARRSPACTPTSTAWGPLMRIGNVDPSRSTSAACRSGSARATLRSSSPSASTIPDIRFEIVYGISGNKRAWYDNSNAYRLGYQPQDDCESLRRGNPGAREAGRPTRSPSATRAACSAAAEEVPNPAAPKKARKRRNENQGAEGRVRHAHAFLRRRANAKPGTPNPGHFTVPMYRELQKKLGPRARHRRAAERVRATTTR